MLPSVLVKRLGFILVFPVQRSLSSPPNEVGQVKRSSEPCQEPKKQRKRLAHCVVAAVLIDTEALFAFYIRPCPMPLKHHPLVFNGIRASPPAPTKQSSLLTQNMLELMLSVASVNSAKGVMSIIEK